MVLVVVAHPDDEVLGCGGAMARHVGEGEEVGVICMTNGTGSRGDQDGRLGPALEASRRVGFEWLAQHDFPDQQLDSVGTLTLAQQIERDILPISSAHLVYTHHLGDRNQDHRAVYKAVCAVFRPQDGEDTPEIRTMEVVSSTEWGDEPFAPNLWLGMKPRDWQAKVEGCKAYAAEMREWPHTRSYRSVEYLARHRGSQVGLPMAEAFRVIWRVVP